MGSQPVGARFWTRASLGVLAHPRLWSTALVQAGRLSRPRWWRRPPFLPIPDADYLRFRFETQYGPDDPDPGDLVRYLEWCRDMSHRAGTGHR
jgi:hypothetical protein